MKTLSTVSSTPAHKIQFRKRFSGLFRFILVIVCSFTSYAAFSQEDYQFLFNIKGIDLGNRQQYDFEGTTIDVHTYKDAISADILKDAKKQNGLKKKLEPIELAGFDDFAYIYSHSKQLESDVKKVTTVFVHEKDSLASYIAFHGWRFDTILYQQFLNAYLNNMLPHGLLIDHAHADSVTFLNRKIILGPVCDWMAPRNIQCRGKGQMNWSVHSSLQHAQEAADFQYYFTKNEYPMKLITQENVPITFEGAACIAKKVVWKVKGINGFLAREMDGSNKLVVYYVAVEVDGQFIHCVLSHWDNDPVYVSSGLPPLLNEVMIIDNQ